MPVPTAMVAFHDFSRAYSIYRSTNYRNIISTRYSYARCPRLDFVLSTLLSLELSIHLQATHGMTSPICCPCYHPSFGLAIQDSASPRSSSAGTMRIVFVCPMPPLHPCTHTTFSPRLRTPSFIACLMPHLRRLSTSICQFVLLKSGFASLKRKAVQLLAETRAVSPKHNLRHTPL